MKTRSSIISEIKKSFKAAYQADIIELIRPSICLESVEGKLSVGTSKFGGSPDLPKEVEWPVSSHNHIPLTFLAQFNLNEIASFDEEEILPQTGMLYFFWDLDYALDGKVLFFDSKEALEPKPIPEALLPVKQSFFQKLLKGREPIRSFSGSLIAAKRGFYIPYGESHYFDQLCSKHDELESSYDMMIEDEEFGEGYDDTFPDHRLLGHYQAIQNNYLESTLDPAPSNMSQHESSEDLSKYLEWKLLFQFDSDDSLGWSWGDGGRIYFFIHQNDLAKRDFSKVMVTGDCY